MEDNRNDRLVACFCRQCGLTNNGFQIVTARVREYHEDRSLREYTFNRFSHNVSAIIANIEANTQSEAGSPISLSPDANMDIDIGDFIIDDAPAPSPDAVSSHRLVPFNNEDEVFAVDDDEFVNGELNDNEVINAEDLEFGNDGDIENDVANHDQGTYFDPPPATTPEIYTYQHPLILVVIFLVLFQLYFVSEHLSSIIINFCIVLLQDIYPTASIPTSLATLRRITGFSTLTDSLRKYVSCPRCHSLFLLADPNCPRTCTNDDIRYPNSCQNVLFRTIRNYWKPIKEYSYQPLSSSITRLFMRPSFEAKIEEWRSRSRVADTFYDVFDGDMWREFADRDGHQFVAEPRSLLLTLNVDWFGPFENSTYSCGAIYLTVNNLPRSERFKTENVILIGVMPGPREASTSDINHYLRPIVDELLEWYNGKRIVTAEHPDGVCVRLALLNVACDIPPARKVSGFTSHASRCGCHKCHRQFSVFPGTTNLDYSGFDIDNWIS
ncbi:hypothetical protein INT45_014176, partial [Circinella minor]